MKRVIVGINFRFKLTVTVEFEETHQVQVLQLLQESFDIMGISSVDQSTRFAF